MAAHAVGCSGIEAVVAEEPAGMICCQHLSVKEHTDKIRITSAEFHIVRYHDNGDALCLQLLQDLRKGLLEETVDALGGFVQQQKFRLGQQYLGQSRSLLFAAGKVIGMAVQQLFNLAGGCNFLNQRFVLRHLLQVFPDGFLHKEALGVLGQHGKGAAEQFTGFVFLHRLAEHLHLTPVGTADAADGF